MANKPRNIVTGKYIIASTEGEWYNKPAEGGTPQELIAKMETEISGELHEGNQYHVYEVVEAEPQVFSTKVTVVEGA